MDKTGDYLGDDINEKYQEIRGSTEHVKTENSIETRENDAYNAHISREDDKIKEITKIEFILWCCQIWNNLFSKS